MKIHILKQKTAEYRLRPQVVETGREFSYTVRGLGIETALTPGEDYTIRIVPQEETATAVTLVVGDDGGRYPEIPVTADENGVLHFSAVLDNEEMYGFRLINKNGERLFDIKVYAAEHDLWERMPMRGNTHCHACHSVDGHEDPIIAASVYRKAGYDYLAITDHHLIDGSAHAIEHIKGIPTEMSLYYGEEVHVPNAFVHAVNVGAVLEGGVGLDVWYHAHEAEINAEIEKTAAEADGKLPRGVEKYDYAWRKWIADTIRENGGVAIAAHPFWDYDGNNTRNAMLRYMAQTKMYDAVEVIHGQDGPDTKEANRAIAFWNDMRADGLYLTPVGCDDAHRRSYTWDYGCDFNKATTVIFAKDPSIDGFAEAIRGGYSVAVGDYRDEYGHVVGTYRLTNFTLFLLDHYFPLHDELCFEEGCRMKDAYLGDAEAMEILRRINGRVRRFTDEFFGR